MRIILVFFILACFTLISKGLAQQYSNSKSLSRAVFALQHSEYDCDGLVESIKDVKNFKYSFLYNTFDNSLNGENVACIKKLNSLKQTKMMQVHLINETCQRDMDCGEYELVAGMTIKQYQDALINRDVNFINKLKTYLEKAENTLLPTLRKDIKCFISPGLESNLNEKAAKSLISITREFFGDRCEIVWNPVGNNKFNSKIENTHHEVHGPKVKLEKPCIANLDGVDIKFKAMPSLKNNIKAEDLKSYLDKYKHCEAAFLWSHADNCINVSKFIDPRKRTKCIDAKMHKKIIDSIK